MHHANNPDGEHLSNGPDKRRDVCTSLQLKTIVSIFIYIYLRSGTPKSSGAKKKIRGIEKMLRFHRDLNSDRRIQSPEC